jgi:hypothetical protein
MYESMYVQMYVWINTYIHINDAIKGMCMNFKFLSKMFQLFQIDMFLSAFLKRN